MISLRHQMHCCLRCDHRWYGRASFKGNTGLPKRCPSCRSKYWNAPKQRMTFKDDRRLKANRGKQRWELTA